MKNFTKGIILFAVLFTVTLFSTYGQTNVSGGIYTNTTWTLAHSPYIVTDTVVVFPGVTLTIEPGVIVKFDDAVKLEIRQGTLNAIGAVNQGITFRSSSNSSNLGLWAGIFVNNSVAHFSYCNFNNADVAVENLTNNISKCNFNYNKVGLASPENIRVDSCSFLNNNYAINDGGTFPVTSLVTHNFTSHILNISYCNISNNILGICGISNHGTISKCIFDNNRIGIGFCIPCPASMVIDSCHIGNNQYGIYWVGDGLESLSLVKNSIIENNIISGVSRITNCEIRNCQINDNGTGLNVTSQNIIDKNSIYSNGVGIACTYNNNIFDNIIEDNDSGIVITYNFNNTDVISCNRICNNRSYNLMNMNNVPLNVHGNYWCTTDSALVASHIYDGYDNLNLGFVSPGSI